MKKNLSEQELSGFCNQVAMILKTGTDMEEGIDLMSEELESSTYKCVLEEIKKSLDEGELFQNALIKTKQFPQYMLDMIKIGYKSGKIEEVFESLAKYYQRKMQMKAIIKNAIFYPVILMTMLAGVLLLLVIKVLPAFNAIFEGLGTQMSEMGQQMMAMGTFVSRNVLVIVGVIVILGIGVMVIKLTGKGKSYLQSIVQKFKISEELASSEIATSMAMMLESGLDTQESLELIVETVTHNKVKDKLNRCIELLSEGKGLIESMNTSELFTKKSRSLLAVGIKTGCIDQAMNQVANTYAEDVECKIDQLLNIIEPTAIVVMSVLVGSIMLSVMLPLIGIMSSIG